uniref:Cytochrome P450 n=1 Tax=Heligmosomoides polygyrus TaxID=6339 RepID=A0A183FLH3_HELPZ
LELQRFANIIAINAPHRTVRDTCIGSVPIPADTMLALKCFDRLVLAHRFLMLTFMRYAFQKAIEHFCPFSIGKRLCVGEGLAKIEIFIGLVTLLQNYKIEAVKGREISLESTLSTVLLPKPQSLCLTPV